MKKSLKLSFLFIVLIIKLSYGQSYSNIIASATENSLDSVIFQHCLDSIEKYVYLDSRKIKPYMAVCDELLTSKAELPNRLRFEYVIQLIYNEYNYNNPLAVMEIIATNRKMMDLKGVHAEQKNRFRYLDGYTLLQLGEAEDAQETFYELLEIANAKRDTSLMLQSLGALGALFGMQKDYENAEKYSLAFFKLISDDQPVHRANGYVELIRMYLESKQIDKAENYNQAALQLVDSIDLVDLKLDFLLQKVSINLERGKSDVALQAYRDASAVADSIGNLNYQQLCMRSYAEILEFQNRYGEALSVYDQFITDSKEGDVAPAKLLPYYQSASKVADKKGDFEKAFRYIIMANHIEDSLFVEEQKGKSQYLRIKFDAEQKEKENELLSAQILQKQSQNRFLYALIALFLIGTLFLIAAYLQKRKYNKLLESEVKSRTSELVDSNRMLQNLNAELSELTYSLSHDLKEPLLTIVGFSEMALEEASAIKATPKDRLVKSIDYVNKSGKRLHLLIEDIARFQSIGEPLQEEMKMVDVNSIVDSSVDSIQYLLHNKDVLVEFEYLPIIYTYETLLFLVFKNLIENGVKYNKSSTPTIHIDYKRDDNFHIFHVKDNGIGIAPEFHNRVFGMFKRLHNREDYEGSGLGLNIVKKIVDNLGGSVGIIESELNKGSLFKISIPILNPSEPDTL